VAVNDLAIDVSIVSIPIANHHFSSEAIMEKAAIAKITKYKNKLIAAKIPMVAFTLQLLPSLIWLILVGQHVITVVLDCQGSNHHQIIHVSTKEYGTTN
jgi:hypothetical protein